MAIVYLTLSIICSDTGGAGINNSSTILLSMGSIPQNFIEFSLNNKRFSYLSINLIPIDLEVRIHERIGLRVSPFLTLNIIPQMTHPVQIFGLTTHLPMYLYINKHGFKGYYAGPVLGFTANLRENTIFVPIGGEVGYAWRTSKGWFYRLGLMLGFYGQYEYGPKNTINNDNRLSEMLLLDFTIGYWFQKR